MHERQVLNQHPKTKQQNLLEDYFCNEQPASLPLPYQQGSRDERGKVSVFWESLISFLAFTAKDAPTTGLLFFLSNEVKVLSVKTEASEDVPDQTAVVKSIALPVFQCMFTCERVALAASVQFLNKRDD